MWTVRLALVLLAAHAVAYFGAIAAFGYDPDRAFLFPMIVDHTRQD